MMDIETDPRWREWNRKAAADVLSRILPAVPVLFRTEANLASASLAPENAESTSHEMLAMACRLEIVAGLLKVS